MWGLRQSANFRFKIDENYVGEPPPIEVTIFQLNDNIDKQFLRDMLLKYGPVEELCIYYHPLTNKHLGIGRVVFEAVKDAKLCVEKLNNTSVMGKILQVFLDPFGEKCKAKFDECTVEKKIEEKPVKVEEKKVVEEERKIEPKKEEKEHKEELKPPVKERESRDSRQYGRSYIRNDYATPSSSDMAYGTGSQSEFSTVSSYGSSNTTPLKWVFCILLIINISRLELNLLSESNAVHIYAITVLF